MTDQHPPEQIEGIKDRAEQAAATAQRERAEIEDAIGASKYILEYCAPRHRAGLMTGEEYRLALLDAINKNRRAAHLHPAGNHASWAAKHQRAYNSLRGA